MQDVKVTEVCYSCLSKHIPFVSSRGRRDQKAANRTKETPPPRT
jgi:hypothetical protein